MSKLYFKYGTMNSSKTANLLMTKHNYEEQGMEVFLIKPAIDTRDVGVIKSRIGLEAKCVNFSEDASIYDVLTNAGYSVNHLPNVLIVDESQFCTSKQVEELLNISIQIPVLCYGLKTDSHTKLFPGSQRLLELAESIQEIKTICTCGKKATINARINDKGFVVLNAPQIDIGGNDKYKPMCKECFVLNGGSFSE